MIRYRVAARALACILVAVVAWAASTLAPSEAADTLVGRYRFVPIGTSAGYKYDTATGELRQVFIDGERLIWEGIEGLNVIGRFELVPRPREQMPPTWFLVDTATGNVWRITSNGAVPLGKPN